MEIENGFAAGKELAALDEHQVRSWTILALLACALLSVLAAAQPPGGHPADGQLIPLTATRSAGCSPDCASSSPHPPCSCTGHDGDAATKPLPGPATTTDEPLSPLDYEVSLEY